MVIKRQRITKAGTTHQQPRYGEKQSLGGMLDGLISCE
jgi:hypothetical protein